MIPEFTDAKILVVDDEPANVALIERLLVKSGYTNVQTTTDPRVGLEIWEAFQPDLLLLDLMMPDLDGFEFLEHLEARQGTDTTAYVPVLVLTADVTAPTRDRALASGAKDFLTKPFDLSELRLRVRNLLDARSLHVRLNEANQILEQRVAERTAALEETLDELAAGHVDLHRSRRETVQRLSIAAEFRDDDTGHHIHRMSHATAILARAAGFDEEAVSLIRMASQMHDLGKIGIPDNILLKPGKLTEDERVVIEQHPQIGHDILAGSDAPLLHLAATIALTHHERFDGKGYPCGLAGSDIPVEGRMAAIADVFDALTNDRVYRPAFSLEKATAIMTEGRGTQFDPQLLDLFFECLPQVLESTAFIEQGVEEHPEWKVSERGQLEAERLAVERMKDEILSIVGHELRTPVTAIRSALGLVSMTTRGTLPDRGQRMLDLASSEAERLVKVVEQIFDVQHILSGKTILEKTDVSVPQVVQAVLDVMQEVAGEASVTLVNDCGPVTVSVDANLLKQMLRNLLSNAIQFSSRGDCVTVSVKDSGEDVIFSVVDTGSGIPRDKLDFVFGRFQQVDSSDSRDHGGIGLGLSICKGIVEAHGGRIWVESSPGSGATFRFAIPGRKSADPTDEPLSRADAFSTNA